MVFWIICVAITGAVGTAMIWPMLRPAKTIDSNPDIALYKGQMAEIDRDVTREILNQDEAENARAEVARRLIAAQKMTASTQSKASTSPMVAVFVGSALLAVSLLTYVLIGAPGYRDLPLQARLDASEERRASRPSQAALEAAAPALPPPAEISEDYIEVIGQLREIAQDRLGNLEVWMRLAFHETELLNFSGAARARQQIIQIKGDEATLLDRQLHLDAMVFAANGVISPEAEGLARQILDIDDTNQAARFYLGLLYDQTDRADLAFQIWRDLVETGDPANFHVGNARAQISGTAFRAGIEYALPETRGPSFEDMDAASALSPEERAEMIGGMVAGLANRLATEGGTAQDWARLIRAYGVLGDLNAAGAVWEEAQQVFAASMRGMEILSNAARDAGVLME